MNTKNENILQSSLIFISEGAEAKIYLKNNSTIIKDRIKKNYRNEFLDEKIRKFRTKREIKILKKLHELKIKVPNVISTNKFSFEMEYINGTKIRNLLNEKNHIIIAKKLGHIISQIHNNGIIHSDLTTSNMLVKTEDLNNDNFQIYLIDFGLSFFSIAHEDIAVDLFLLKRGLMAKHHLIAENFIKHFFENYNPKEKKEILKKLEIVEMRGRNKAKC